MLSTWNNPSGLRALQPALVGSTALLVRLIFTRATHNRLPIVFSPTARHDRMHAAMARPCLCVIASRKMSCLARQCRFHIFPHPFQILDIARQQVRQRGAAGEKRRAIGFTQPFVGSRRYR